MADFTVSFTESNESFNTSFGEVVSLADMDEAYEAGKAEGATEGYANGYGAGKNDGLVEGETIGYEKGHADGVTEGVEQGKQAEYDRFWDSTQQNGNLRNYDNVFGGLGWNMTTFKPKYDIIVTAAYMMFRATGIVDLGEALGGKKCVFNLTTLQYTFNNARLLEVIDGVEFPRPFTNINTAFQYDSKLREIRVPIPISETATSLNDAFASCSALEYVRFTGTIPVSFSFQWCGNLTAESAKSVIMCLKNYAGTSKEFAYTIRFHANVWAALDAEGNAAPDGSTWRDYVSTTLCWNI